jgi:hypothetical protein
MCLQLHNQVLCRYLISRCPTITKQAEEMADVRWFHWQWVARTQGWLQPSVGPTAFHIPGPSSLAHRLLRMIAQEHMTWEGASVPDCIIEEGRHVSPLYISS